MNSIRLELENQQEHSIETDWIAERLRAAIAREVAVPVELVVAFVDDRRIREINREFLEHDWSTDVISFSYTESEGTENEDAEREEGARIAGELVISVETGLREAATHGWSLEAELLLYAIHGFLHLCGYDDLSDEDRPAMRQRERELMADVGDIPGYLQS